MRRVVAIALGLSLFATPAFAYIGPGAGITVLGALWGVVVAVVFALAAVVLWPLRLLLRRRRHKPALGPRSRPQCPPPITRLTPSALPRAKKHASDGRDFEPAARNHGR